MARFLAGDVTELCAASQTVVHERPLVKDGSEKGKVTVDDVSVATLKFKSGALGTIDASWMAAGKKDYFYFEVHGSEGSVRFNFERLTELEVYLKDQSGLDGYKTVIATSKKYPEMDKFWPDNGGGFGWNHLFVVELKHFLDWAAGGKRAEYVPTFRDGYINSLLIDSIAESSRREKWIKIEPML